LEHVVEGLSPIGLTNLSRESRLALLEQASAHPALHSGATLIDDALDALTEQCAFPRDTSQGFRSSYPELGQARTLATILRVDAHRTLQAGNSANAIARVVGIIRLSDSLATGENVLIQMLALHVLETGLQAIEDYHDTLAREDTERLLSALQCISDTDPLRARAGLIGEFEMARRAYKDNLIPAPGDQFSDSERAAASDAFSAFTDQLIVCWDQGDDPEHIRDLMDGLQDPVARYLCPNYDRYLEIVVARRAQLARVRHLLREHQSTLPSG